MTASVEWPITGTMQGVNFSMALVYTLDDPFAVRLRADLSNSGKDWIFSRLALLRAFSYLPADDSPAHDIWIHRTGAMGAQVEIVLMPHGQQPASIFFSTRDVHRFLQAVHTLCANDDQATGLVDWAAAESELGLESGQLTHAREPNHRREAS